MQMVMGAEAFMPMPSALGARSSVLPAAASRPVPPPSSPRRARRTDQYFHRLQPPIFLWWGSPPETNDGNAYLRPEDGRTCSA